LTGREVGSKVLGGRLFEFGWFLVLLTITIVSRELQIDVPLAPIHWTQQALTLSVAILPLLIAACR
jgi:hypothetical protein